MSCEDCLSRREFLTRSTLAVAGAAALGACGDGQFGPTAVTSSVTSLSIKVSTIPALATVGQLAMVPPASARIAVKRTGTTTFLAISTICTHQQCETNIVSNTLECPCHGSRYDSDGKVTRQPQAAGSATNLPSYATRYDAATDTLTIG
jgi:Rieske Fe-S protein